VPDPDVIDIQWLTPDGAGGAPRPRGGTVRIPGAIPGDRIRYAVDSCFKRSVIGELLEVVRPSPLRRAPPCPDDTRCGGCDLSAMEPDGRREALARVVQRALGLHQPPPVTPSPRQVAHRARIALAIEESRIGYRAARSHTLVEVGTCGIARPEVQRALSRVRAWASRGTADGLTRVELRSDGARIVYSFASEGPVPRAAREPLTDLGDVALDGRPLHGDCCLRLRVAGLELHAGPTAFYQVNLEVNALLVDHVLTLADAVAPERVVDLYAGIGNLTLPLAARGWPVTAVELSGAAVADLRTAAAEAGLAVEARAGDVARTDLTRFAYDLAVLDPPRKGAGPVIDQVLATRPRQVIYVSCNPVAAGRDARRAARHGYQVDGVRCFDMFPDTHHLETVVSLRRRSR